MQTIDPKRKLTKPVSYHLTSLTLLVATVLLIDAIFGFDFLLGDLDYISQGAMVLP